MIFASSRISHTRSSKDAYMHRCEKLVCVTVYRDFAHYCVTLTVSEFRRNLTQVFLALSITPKMSLHYLVKSRNSFIWSKLYCFVTLCSTIKKQPVATFYTATWILNVHHHVNCYTRKSDHLFCNDALFYTYTVFQKTPTFHYLCITQSKMNRF